MQGICDQNTLELVSGLLAAVCVTNTIVVTLFCSVTYLANSERSQWTPIIDLKFQNLLTFQVIVFSLFVTTKMSTAPKTNESGKKILIPVDGSENSERAFQCK